MFLREHADWVKVLGAKDTYGEPRNVTSVSCPQMEKCQIWPKMSDLAKKCQIWPKIFIFAKNDIYGLHSV